MASLTSALPLTKSAITIADFEVVGFTLGRITNAEHFPAKAKLRVPAYQVTVNFGSLIGSKQSSAQLPSNYPEVSSLFGRCVVSVVNMPKRKIAGFNSEILIVGFPDDHGHVHLLNTRQVVPTIGSHLTLNQKGIIQPIEYKHFEAIDVRAATITSMERCLESELAALKTDSALINASTLSDYLATFDLGEIGQRKALISSINQILADELIGTQAPVVVNLQNESAPNFDTHVLAFMHEGMQIPLGVDKPVKNGVALF